MGVLGQLVVAGCLGFPVAVYLLLKLFPWLKYDFQELRMLGRILIIIKGHERRKDLMCDVFEKRVDETPDKTFLIFQGNNYSYDLMEKQMNRMAHAALEIGLRKGEVVAMLMTNEPAFIWTSYGLSKVGVQPAFLNFNLRKKSLFHCFKVSSAKVLIIGQDDELVTAVKEIYSDLESLGVKVYVNGSKNSEMPSDFTPLDDMLSKAPSRRPSKSYRQGITLRSPMCYIYTSGTTGLPKAAVVTHDKVFKGALLMSSVNVTMDDIIYTPLPLYHSAAGLIALGATIHNGATLVLRNKFSATHFIEDCRKYGVTVVQYIGELCRYLCATPKSPDDQNHKIRIAFGNGLRRDIWREFRDRFNIKQIGEFYAATEGNGGFINHYNRFASVGRTSPLLRLAVPTHFIKYDIATDQPVRGRNGLCQRVEPREAGLLVVQIKRNFDFDGYKGNRELSDKKILRDVFKKGDVFFNTGDMMELDEDYFVYFKDRVGDTYRWKGENVSTIEVSNVVADVSWIQDANVYGVEINGQDGRAGMAAIAAVDGHKITTSDLTQLYSHCSSLLPAYACPRFIRIQDSMIVTASSLKLQKVELVKQGYNPENSGRDPVYCVDFSNKTYVPLDTSLYDRINSGSLRL